MHVVLLLSQSLGVGQKGEQRIWKRLPGLLGSQRRSRGSFPESLIKTVTSEFPSATFTHHLKTAKTLESSCEL